MPLTGQALRCPHGVDDLDDVAALAVVVEPLRVAGAHIQTPVAGIGVALGADRPWRGVYEDAAVGNLRGPLDVGAIPVGRVDGHPVGRGVHDDVLVPSTDDVEAIGRRGAVLTH